MPAAICNHGPGSASKPPETILSGEESQSHPTPSRCELRGAVHLQASDRSLSNLSTPSNMSRFVVDPEVFVPQILTGMVKTYGGVADSSKMV
jgi:hypothetical protein